MTGAPLPSSARARLRASARTVVGGLRAATLDLALGSRCLCCGTPGPACCPRCHDDLLHVHRAVPVARVTAPDGAQVPVWAGAPYAHPWSRLVVAHKEQQLWALAGVLGDLLTRTAHAALASPSQSTSPLSSPLSSPPSSQASNVPTWVVPVPSSPGVSRQRGYDPLDVLAARVAAALRSGGVPARRARLLRSRGGVRDQVGLPLAERLTNPRGSLWVPGAALAAAAATAPRARLLVIDDVVTTGATLGEAVRALTAVGLRVGRCAVLTVTPAPGSGNR